VLFPAREPFTQPYRERRLCALWAVRGTDMEIDFERHVDKLANITAAKLEASPRPSPRLRLPDDCAERDCRTNPPEGDAFDSDDG